MNELAIEKLELLIKDLKDMQELEKETGRQHFTLQLFAIRVKEIYKLLEKNSQTEIFDFIGE